MRRNEIPAPFAAAHDADCCQRMPFPTSPRVVFQKNPLAEVICQLRFPPILKIATEYPAAFQELVRDAYPYFQEEKLDIPEEVAGLLGRLGALRPPEQATSRFVSENEQQVIALNREFVSVSTTSYRRWESFRVEVGRAVDALEAVYQPSFYFRIGLRYRDVIDREALGLAQEPWNTLLSPALLGLLGDNQLRHEVREASSNILLTLAGVEDGLVRLRHGFGKRTDTEHVVYLIDADFFCEGKRGRADVTRYLDAFNGVAGNLFRWAISQRLQAALEPVPI